MKLSADWIVPASLDTDPSITSDHKYFPFFRNVLGALDGCLVPVWVPPENQSPWRDRKGNISQNVLAVCDFDLCFTAVYSGMEGSAPDTKVFKYVVDNDMMQIPDNYFYLGDAGYALSRKVLTPFRGIRYHLKEWGQGNQRFDRLPVTIIKAPELQGAIQPAARNKEKCYRKNLWSSTKEISDPQQVYVEFLCHYSSRFGYCSVRPSQLSYA